MGHTVVSFPSTVVHTLPVVLAGTPIEVVVAEIPPSWYAPQTDLRADAFLNRVTSTAQHRHGLAAVAELMALQGLSMLRGTSPRVVAVIPARGGSKGVPGKNLRRVGGRSLVERAVDACRSARLVDAVYVSTDDPDIARAATAAGALVIDRPVDLAGDTASSESALLHALDHLDSTGGSPEVLVFVQCTSPFIAADDLDRGIRLVTEGPADSAFSGVATYEFLWRRAVDAGVDGQNHDPRVRPRRQDRAPDFRETGAFYVMAVDGFRAARHRFFGRTEVVEVSELTAVDIDHEHDVMLATALAEVLDPVVQIEVDVVITDFDGVHTDDSVLVDQDGRESVRVSRSDGLGVEMLRHAGVPVLIVSKETNPVVRARARKLGVGCCTVSSARGRWCGTGWRPMAFRPIGPPTSATTSTISVRWAWSAGRWPWPTRTRPCDGPPGWCSTGSAATVPSASCAISYLSDEPPARRRNGQPHSPPARAGRDPLGRARRGSGPAARASTRWSMIASQSLSLAGWK